MNTMAEKNTDILLDQALHEIHLTVWSRFINENNLLLDYTELSGNISLPTPDECEQNQPNALDGGRQSKTAASSTETICWDCWRLIVTRNRQAKIPRSENGKQKFAVLYRDFF